MQDAAASHRQLYQIVTEHLRSAILEGKFRPGEWLRQQRIADALGVSQMPVREALKTLAAEGVVEYIPYRGARVVGVSSEDVVDLYAQRSFLEGRAARAAADTITEKDLAQLRTIHVQMHGQMTSSLSRYSSLNRRFHQIIYTSSERDYLIHALDHIWSTFTTTMMSCYAQISAEELEAREAQDLREHGDIIAALESGDGTRAEQVMRRHIEMNCEELIAALDTRD